MFEIGDEGVGGTEERVGGAFGGGIGGCAGSFRVVHSVLFERIR